MKYSLSEITKILQVKPPPDPLDFIIRHILTDSRKLIYPFSSLFVAIVTKQQDGHQFIPELYEQGVRAFLVSEDQDTKQLPEAAFIKVKNTLRAFQDIAAAHRKSFSIPVVGITGSNGKTIVKEWLYQLLAPDLNIVRSPKSFNSQIGVPLSVLQMNSDHQLAIFEAGISQPDEMIFLEKMIRPSIGIFTNIGEAHAEGFENIRQKIREKLFLFSHSNLLIYRKDNPVLQQEIHSCYLKRSKNKKEPLQLFTWSCLSDRQAQEEEADLKITGIKQVFSGKDRLDQNQYKTHIEGIYQNKSVHIEIPFTDQGSIENAIHCWCLLLWLKTDQKVIRQRMAQLAPVAMRLELKQAINDCSLINDSYNSDLGSLTIALDFLSQQRQHKKHTVILSDILQSGRNNTGLYKEVAGLLEQKKVDRFIGIGKNILLQKGPFLNIPKLNCSFYPATDAFMQEMMKQIITGRSLPFHQETILLKGARAFEFERIDRLLQKQIHQTILEINLNALTHNLKTYQSLLKPGVRTMVMVKAFSYGSGSFEIANLLQFHKVDYLAVANTDEGVELRQNGITLPIMVMNPEPLSFETLIQWKLEPEIYSLRMLHSLINKLKQHELPEYPLHIKLDTGMHRLGFMEDEIPSLIKTLKENKTIKVASVFSHLAASEDPTMEQFTNEQGRRFDEMSKNISDALSYSFLRHLANTSAISRYPHLQYDMVRLGIGLYGIDQSEDIREKLQVVSTLKTTVSQVKNIKAGETVGYGRAGKADTAKKIATVSIGYADGYLRSLGLGKGYMLIHGKPASTIGKICMDMLMLDVTDIPDVKEGDTVIVFGKKPTLQKIAELAGTIPYEIMTSISQRVKRIYVQE